MTGTTGSTAAAVAAGDCVVGLEVEAGGAEVTEEGEGEAEGAADWGGMGTGLGVRSSPPVVAHPVRHVQQMPKANQKVADRFERRM